MRKSKLSLVMMVAIFALVAGVAYALGQQEQPPPPPTVEGEENATDAEDPKAPKRFVPTQKTSADNNATFPVDI